MLWLHFFPADFFVPMLADLDNSWMSHNGGKESGGGREGKSISIPRTDANGSLHLGQNREIAF